MSGPLPTRMGPTETGQKEPGGRRAWPGEPDRAERIARILRVDHAGEYGAVRIYQGQLAVLKDRASAASVRRMAAQEQKHLDAFDRLLPQRRVRPTLLGPLWGAAGFALGAATALMGERAAMACTVAVEEVIDEHYSDQIAQLGDDEKELRDTLENFRRDELDHRAEALEHGAALAPGYEVLTTAVKTASRLAIWLSTRL